MHTTRSKLFFSRLFRALAVVSLFLISFQAGGAPSARALTLRISDHATRKGIQPLAADGSSFYYYADGQRIPLQPSLNWVSVKFASTDINKQSSALRNSVAPFEALDQARHIPDPQLKLLPVQAGTTVQTLVQG